MTAAIVPSTMDMSVGLIDVGGTQARYPARAPYHPDSQYPELPFAVTSDQPNLAYRGVRELLYGLGYDAENCGTARWNPLGWLVRPGDTVFLKPNMIAHKHADNDDWDYVITHGSVIRAVVDYVYIALQGQGRIVIGDAPQTDSKFEKIIACMGLPELQAFYHAQKHFDVAVVDLRHEQWIEQDGIYVDTVQLLGDPEGTVAVNLGRNSLFSELDGQGKRYYGAYYDVMETNEHHHDGKHEYCISRSPISADVFISLPKLKTHKKCGITLNLKSLVGINGNKNWLPHYAFGSPETGGDQFPCYSRRNLMENSLVVGAKRLLLRRKRAAQLLARKSKQLGYWLFGGNERVVRSGNWHGNDTVWRMALDLNRILLYGNRTGTMGRAPKRYFSVVDALVAMEGNGPVAGQRRVAGVIAGGPNPAAVDAACVALMGFDYQKLPMLRRAFEAHEFSIVTLPYDAIRCISNRVEWQGNPRTWRSSELLDFHPHFAWQNHVELEHER